VTYYIYVNSGSSTASSNGPFQLSIIDGPSCSCDAIPLCGTPAETEPNGTCPGQIDPIALTCGSEVYGLHCPESDRDMFAVSVPPMTRATIMIFDGANCTVNPAACARMDVRDLDSCYALLTGVAGTIFATNPGATSFDFLLDVYGAPGCRSAYRVVITCCPITDYCANPIIIPGVLHY
jgi:hypothetical protein